MSTISAAEHLASLQKTQICRSLMNGVQCSNTRCTYAHSREELRVPRCRNGAGCFKMNSKTNPCYFVHPVGENGEDEKPEDYCFRTDREWVLDVKIPELKEEQKTDKKPVKKVVKKPVKKVIPETPKVIPETPSSYYVIEILFRNFGEYQKFETFLVSNNSTMEIVEGGAVKCFISPESFVLIAGLLVASRVCFGVHASR